MAESPSNTRRRRAILAGFALVGVLGLAGGAAANVGIARLLALPEDAQPLEYADAPLAATDATADATEAAPAVAARPRALPKRQYGDAIVRRNIFDSTAVYNPQAAVAGGAGECKADSTMKLLATVVAEPMQYSSALISAGGGRDARASGYSIGDELNGEGRITLIEQKKVCLDGGSCICIGSDTAIAAKAPASAGADAEGGVEKLSDTKFVVESSVIADAMTNFEALAGQLRVVPHKDSSGTIDGYRLSAIRRGSLFDKLGIKNGDVVHAVNGTALTSTEGALSTYQTLKNEKAFNFDITRRNQRQTMEYEVR